jgi:hypothetical protein
MNVQGWRGSETNDPSLFQMGKFVTGRRWAFSAKFYALRLPFSPISRYAPEGNYVKIGTKSATLYSVKVITRREI